MFKNRKQLLIHSLVWAAILFFPFIFSSAYYESNDRHQNDFLYLDAITKVFWIFLFYFNVTFAIPKLFLQRKYITFVLLESIYFIGMMIVHKPLFILLVEEHEFNFFRASSHNLVSFVFVVLTSLVFKSVVDKTMEDTKAKETQNENLKTELSLLRSQISPHFIFNVLNNMVALARMKSEQLEPTIMKLSSFLQYVLYQTDEDKIQINSEVEYLKSYIDLQSQRFGPKLIIHQSFNVVEDYHVIEPMLLIPFVENAFKHGVGMLINPEIFISLSLDNSVLEFSVKNKFSEKDTVKDSTTGIGLANVKRRLELLYQDNYLLDIKSNDGWFEAILTLKIEKK